MAGGAHEAEVSRLWSEAAEALNEDDHRRAMALGKRLVRLRFSGGWEVMARAYVLRDQLERAIATLERGLKLVPEAGALWMQLGICQDDAGRWSASQRSFERALACPHHDADAIWANWGAMLVRAGQPTEALAALGRLSDGAEPELRLFAQVQRLAALNRAERWAECIAAARAWLPTVPAEADPELLGQALGLVALALARSGGDPAEVRAAALQALSHWRVIATALEALRLLRGVRSAANCVWLVSFEGTATRLVSPDEGPLGFFTSYEVIADSEELAVALARELERESEPEPLRVERVSRLDAVPDRLQGVIGRNGYILFDRDAGPRRGFWQRLLRR